MHSLAVLTAALQLIGPPLDTAPTKGTNYELTWTSVDTDPQEFDIDLVNFTHYPPLTIALA